ncbi:MAG: cytochrome c biogenesis protein CcsA, partial [Epsilonproteobacteria bacterium]|nr:cytochrome c biogenesis protein CcsA [Campylobacterota bacterium]
NDPNKSWYNPLDAIKAFPQKEGQFVKYIVSSYIRSVLEGIEKGDWKKANEAVDIISNFQKFYGSELIPPKQKVEAEIFYNRVDIFAKLMLAYIIIGFVLLITAFVSIVKPNLNLKIVTRVATAALVVTLLLHTAGLILRWYIAEHAPWSNAYESILYIAWATALAGFVFAKKSPLSFAATSILTGIFLLVAYISSLNPQITTLMPVLKSYWLMIHVAVITASYGFLGLGALLGMFNLILFIVNGNKNKDYIIRAVKELTIINEITLLIGLALLTVGNFLGGVWANESWGRYWGWDPKETWAAVTILVYAAVTHMRFVPKLNSIYLFNVASLLAYFSVIMTYFGVNYYLSGMHSYAAGDPVPIPTWVYFAVAGVFILIVVAKRFEIKGKI